MVKVMKFILIVESCTLVLSTGFLSYTRTRNLVGYSNILVYGSEIQPECKIIAEGTSDADAVITVDFGQGSCSSGNSVALSKGSIFIGNHEIISFGESYKDIIFAMSDCDDEVVIAKTYQDASSVEVLAYDGDDRIILGDESRPLDVRSIEVMFWVLLYF